MSQSRTSFAGVALQSSVADFDDERGKGNGIEIGVEHLQMVGGSVD
jgi:hypothetical protein